MQGCRRCCSQSKTGAKTAEAQATGIGRGSSNFMKLKYAQNQIRAKRGVLDGTSFDGGGFDGGYAWRAWRGRGGDCAVEFAGHAAFRGEVREPGGRPGRRATASAGEEHDFGRPDPRRGPGARPVCAARVRREANEDSV